MAGISEEEIIELIRTSIAKEVDVNEEKIDINLPISKLEMDSISVIELCAKLETILNRPVRPYMAWDHPTIAKMAEFLASEPPD